MKIIIFGATGKTGQHIWRQALEQGHEVTAFTRSANKIDSREVKGAQGDIMDAAAVAAAVANHQAAIVALGSNGLRDKTTLSAGTRNVVDGMICHNVERLVVLSAAGVGESWGQISLFARVLFRTMLHNIYADHTAQEAIVKESRLDWTIVRAAILKDAPASGHYTAGKDEKVRHIARADVAEFLVKQVDDAAYQKRAVSITS